MPITEEEFAVNLQGYLIVDCAVRNRRFLYFVTRNEDESARAGAISEATVNKRLINYIAGEKFGNRLGHRWFTGRQRASISASQEQEDKIVLVDSSGYVFAAGGGVAEEEASIPKGKDGPRRGAVRRVRMIDGRLYVAGSDHTVCRRRGRNDWESLTLDLPLPTRAQFDNERLSEDMAFNDIDAFSHEDLYVVGGRGVVWHCDGKRWRRVPFPSNMFLESVCCAGDGQVYVGAQSGTLFRGRGDRWQMLERGEMSLPFKDIVWHAGRLWCTSDYGLWTLDGERLVKVDLPSEIAVCTGNLSVADGVMLMAGVHGAAFHDGERWHHIFNHYEMTQAVEAR